MDAPSKKQKAQADEGSDARTLRNRILDAATELMSCNGFSGTSVQAITNKAGVNKALLFYYFDSKAKLFDQILEHYLEGLYQVFVAAAAEPIADVGDRFHRLLDVYIDYIEANPNYARLVQRELADTDGRHATIREHNKRNYEVITKSMEPLTHGIGPRAPKQVFTSFVGMILYYYNSAPILAAMWTDDSVELAINVKRCSDARREHIHWMADVVLRELR